MNEELKAELLSMLSLDLNKRYGKAGQEDNDIDEKNTERMKVILYQYGFPGQSMVGHEAALAAFAIIQHSPDLSFQQSCLPLLLEAARAGELEMRLYAYLEDRVRLKTGHRQLYGSQLRNIGDSCVGLQLLDESEDVHIRRGNVGLEPLTMNMAFYLARRYAVNILHADGNVNIRVAADARITADGKPIKAFVGQGSASYTLEMVWNEEQKQLCVSSCTS